MDKKSFLKDVFSPSNLWGFFQFAFPAAAATVSAWLSHLWHLPPSVSLFLALATAACVLILVSELRKNSVQGKLVLANLYPLRFIWNQSNGTAFAQLRGIFKNNDSLHQIFYRLETLHFSIQGRTHGKIQPISDILEVPPQGDAGYIFWGVDGVTVGPIDGRLHYRVQYGKSPNFLKHRFEQKLVLRGQILFDSSGQPHFDLNWIIEETF